MVLKGVQQPVEGHKKECFNVIEVSAATFAPSVVTAHPALAAPAKVQFGLVQVSAGV